MVGPLQEHRATGTAGCQQCGPIPEGDQPEGTFTQNCRQESMLGHQWSLPQSICAASMCLHLCVCVCVMSYLCCNIHNHTLQREAQRPLKAMTLITEIDVFSRLIQYFS